MKKLKMIFSWIYKFGLSAILIVFLCIAPFTLMPSLLSAQANVNRNQVFNYQGILELWHLECFEGGSASRSAFLEKQAVKFERQNKGVYIVINTMSLEQFKLNIDSGKTPNMLSFGIGVGDSFIEKLADINISNSIRADLLEGGKFYNKQLAVPYILGGYAIMGNSQNNNSIMGSTGTGFSGTINPLQSVLTNNLSINISENINIDTYTAYDKFLKGQFDNLLGTQRDVYRIYNRQQKGLIDNINYKFLSGYNDLVQYISIFKSNYTEEKVCEDFIKQLTSFDTQSQIKNINMFSVLENLCLYSNDIFAEMEQYLLQKLYVNNVFKNIDKIDNEKSTTLKQIRGEDE